MLFTFGLALSDGVMLYDIRQFVAEGLASKSEEVRRQAAHWLDRPLSLFDPLEQVMREAVRQMLQGNGRLANGQGKGKLGLSKYFLDNVYLGWMPKVQQDAIVVHVDAVVLWADGTYNSTQTLGWEFVPGDIQLPRGTFPADERAVEFALYRLALAAAQPGSGVSARGEAQIREAIAAALDRSYISALEVGLDASNTRATYTAAEEVIAAVRALGKASSAGDAAREA